jgi:hypothetical protein
MAAVSEIASMTVTDAVSAAVMDAVMITMT